MEQIILFAPLVGAIIGGFGWRIIGDKGAQVVTTALLFLACLLSWIVFWGHDGTTQHHHILTWVQSGSLDTSLSIRLDRLTAIMLIVVTTVSSLTHLYSMGYMAHDANFAEDESYRPRFFAMLSFFTFTMLLLVTADDILQLFFGWEGVGLASYLLIGFYFRKPSANAAAIKAFVVNRVGDFGFLLGIFAIFYLTDSLKFEGIFAAGPQMAETTLRFLWADWNAANVVAILIFMGAMAKSAQLGLHTWLPDAMEGPTPVSALIHAATMVTAGVFLVCRMSPVLEYASEALLFISFIGATTAIVAATIGCVQMDIKRVIAYSTMSQLGYMVAAAGVGAYSVAMFHLLTHAFFKALLFLCSGAVINGMHHDQDMRNYGGLRHKMPFTFWTMMAGTLAITGVGIPFTHIGFAGFLSKDAVIESSWAGTGGGYAFWMLVVAAALTSFYSWRLMFMTFFGTARGDKHTHQNAHEAPMVMLVPMGALTLGAIFAGMIWYNSFFGDHAQMLRYFGIPAHHAEASESHGEAAAPATGQAGDTDTATAAQTPTAETATADTATAAEGTEAAAAHGADQPTGVAPEGAIFMRPGNDVIEAAHHAPTWVKLSPFVAMVLGLLVALWFYVWNPSMPNKFAAAQRPLYRFLWNKWYFDTIYDFVFLRGGNRLADFLWRRGDGNVIDGIVNGLALGAVPFFTRVTGRAQSGYMFTYAFAMVIGIVVLVTWMTFAGGTN